MQSHQLKPKEVFIKRGYMMCLLLCSPYCVGSVETNFGSFDFLNSQNTGKMISQLVQERTSFTWKYKSQARIEIGSVAKQLNYVKFTFPQYSIQLGSQNTSYYIEYQAWKLQFDEKTHQFDIRFSARL